MGYNITSSFIRGFYNESFEKKISEYVVIGKDNSGLLHIGSDYIYIEFPSEFGRGLGYPMIISVPISMDLVNVSLFFDKGSFVTTKPFSREWGLSNDAKSMFLKTSLISSFKNKLLSCKTFKIKLDYGHLNSVVAIFNLGDFQNLYDAVIKSKCKTLEEFVNSKIEEERPILTIKREALRLSLEQLLSEGFNTSTPKSK
ncbi:hypothetical protein [Borrelia coriaceae]|uniref:hypothetical protein n=1 Tax=Borrelia coriaceae TaxID=144 RepID=UPI0019D704F8|nr:hypothetical protein [Borrelia coriaceae]